MSIYISLNNDNSLSIKGDIDIFHTNMALNNWIINRYNANLSDKEIIVPKKSFSSKNKLYKFKKSLLKKTRNNLDINFNDNFLNTIKEFIIDEDNFKIFSNEAEQIWDNKYDPNHFKNYCDIISDKMDRSLYELQLKSSYHMAFTQHSCNFSVPGAGKTSIVYGAYTYLNSLDSDNSKFVDKIMVIGPTSSFDPWDNEYYECFKSKPNSKRLNGELNSDLKKNILKGISGKSYELLLLTYNSASSLKNEIEIFLKNNKVMLICDEAHRIKGREGIWSSSILNISRFAKSRIILTGTPCPNGYEDLFNLFKYLYHDKNIIPYRYDYLKHLTNSPIKSDIDTMLSSIKPFFIRIKKKDLNLPPYTDIDVISNNLNELEAEVYKKLEESIGKEDNLSPFSLLHRLIQTTSNLHMLNTVLNQYDFDNEPEIRLNEILGDTLSEKIENLTSKNYTPSKFITLLPLVDSLVKKGHKVLIWGNYIDTIYRLNEYFNDNGLNGFALTGRTNNEPDENGVSERQSIIRKFKKNKNVNYLITNPSTLGESVSLHKHCHHAIYLERNYMAAPYVQSRDRIHRVWLKNNVQVKYETYYYHLISNNTIDENIYNRVNSKFKRMTNLIEDDIPLFSNIDNPEETRNALIQDIIKNYNDK